MLNKWLANYAASRHLKNGRILMDMGNPAEAVVEFTKAIKKNSDLIEAHLQRGIAYTTLREVDLAFSDLNLVLAKKPTTSSAYYWRSITYLRKAEIEPAFQDINRAIHMNPDEPANYLLRALLYSRKNEKEAALKDMELAIKLGFEKDGHNNRAIFYEEQGDFIAAIADWTKVIEIDSNHAIAYCRRGILYSKTNDTELAIKDLTRGLKDKTQLPDSLRQESEDLLAKLQAAG
jgi:tetratricopeptide (TPR) repeat protein